MWTYEPRQGRKAATVVCSASAVVTLARFYARMRSRPVPDAIVDRFGGKPNPTQTAVPSALVLRLDIVNCKS